MMIRNFVYKCKLFTPVNTSTGNVGSPTIKMYTNVYIRLRKSMVGIFFCIVLYCIQK